jgi:glyoxylase-like metal-dependent hydrolase (beta-lactamase superfamily II)
MPERAITPPGVPVLVHAGNPGPMTGPGNNTWLVDGRVPTLVDAGVGCAAHLDALAEHLAGRPLARVLVTHGHADHASGVPALRDRWPGVEVARWAGAARLGERPLADVDHIDAGDGTLIVLHTPGHAEDHLCFWNPATRDLFTGDMVVVGSTVMIPGGRGGSLRDYLASLERIAGLDPARLLPGHGPVVDRPLALIAGYIAHRRMRDAQVRACLAEGLTDIDAIVARIYPDIAEAIRPAARLTVEAHLEMIRESA